MRRTILGVGSVFLSLASLAGAYSGGNGTRQDPYQIATAQDLIELGQTPDDYGRSFVLSADIDLADHVFDQAVIAPDTAGDSPGLGGIVITTFDGPGFYGRFDGQGHVIRNLCIDDRTGSYQGLFGNLSAGAEVVNLGLEDVRIDGLSYVGGLVGQNDHGSISLCHIAGTVSGEETVGGLVGHNDHGSISLCHSSGTVRGTEQVGGLVGDNDAGRVSSSYSSAAVHGEEDTGGLVGDNGFGTISSSDSTGLISGHRNVGGLAGKNGWGTISSCHSTGMVNGARKIGGLVGDNTYGAISSSYSTGRVYGNANVGGLVGYIHQSGTITSSCSTGFVHGTQTAGGLLGNLYESGTISSSYGTGGVFSGWGRAGGLAGALLRGGTVSSCYSTGSVSGGRDVGGLVGYTCKETDGGDPNAWVFFGTISSSFWDIESSEKTQSKGGTGLTTAQMQDRSTYVQADWDFVDETANGTQEIWWMPQGDTPRLWWQWGYVVCPFSSVQRLREDSTVLYST